MSFIGIDVGGQSIKGGVVTIRGEVLDKEIVLSEPKKGRAIVVKNILSVIKTLLSKHKDIEAIGIGIPGIVDEKGYIKNTPNLPLSNYNLGTELRKKIKIKIVFGNDADNFVLAKSHFGVAKGKRIIVALTLGTGVGSGIMIDGSLFSNKGAPELGHTTINFEAEKSKCCNNDGCIESYIGRKSFDEGPLKVYKKALLNDKKALSIFQNYGKYLGIAISNFVNIFNPDVIILGGQLSNAYDFFKTTMEKEVKKRSLFKTKIVRNKMLDAGMIGAAVLAF